ncbi:MAG TPA: uracil-DNA glycosylase family protein [Rubrivivax sp.]|nr:uracil-DNA glycosylase family protein [Rubrivivax sp.]
MAWSERQRLMLREMGIRLWAPTVPAVPTAPAAAVPAAVPRSPAPAPLSAPVPVPVSVFASAPAPVPGVAPLSADARAAEIAALPWDALRAAVAACRACALCEARRQTVFGVGHAQAHWMIVGEAPGEQEDLKGEPFVGAAGHLLDNMLRALGLTREAAAPERQVYIANTLKCRPPRNRNPEPQELAACEPFLLRQIELIRPRIILAMGRFAVQSLLRSSEPVGKLRGRVHRCHGVPLVVTYHPAYLLRNLADKSRAWDDLCLAAQIADAADAAAAPL